MNRKPLRIILICLLFIILVLLFAYLLFPKYNIGYINNIKELEDKYNLCYITNFKSIGQLLFIEKRQWSSWCIVVFGKFDDDISIFGNDPRGRNICVENSMRPFFLYEYVYNYRNHKFPGLLKLPVKKVVSSSSGYDYRFIDDVGKIEQKTVQIQGYIESTFFLMIIDPNTKNFVLNLQIRH